MPVEITLPLSPGMQAVADAREDVRKLAARVEDLKTQLKAAKGAWEEAVEELNKKLDELIQSERTPGLFDDHDANEGKAAGAGQPSPEPNAPAGGAPTSVQIISQRAPGEFDVAPGTQSLPALPALAPASTNASGEPTGQPGQPEEPLWRGGLVTEHIDGGPEVFEALDKFGVTTLGQLADALKDGQTFDLPLIYVNELMELIEDVSQEDDEPIRFSPKETDDSDSLADVFNPPLTGENIERLEVSASRLTDACCTNKIHRHADAPKHLPAICVNERLYIVVAHSTGPRGEAWFLRPLWTEQEFAKRHPGEPRGDTEERDRYLGVKVHLQPRKKKQDVFLIGARHEERKLIQPKPVEVDATEREDEREEDENENAPAESTLSFDDL